VRWPRWATRERAVPEFLNVPWSIRDLVLFVVAWMGIQVAALLLLRGLAPVVPGIAHFLSLASKGDVGATFALDLLDAAAGFGVVSLYLHRYGVGWASVGWRRTGLLKAVLYLVGILVVFVVASNVLLLLVSVLDPSFNANQPQTNEFTGATKSHHSLALIALVLLPPVLEETIFRGFIFPALAKRTGVIWGAVISSVIFGVAHFQANIGIYTFVLGLLLCFMYVRLRSIVPGIFLHMLNNYLAFIALSSK
jgi:membrane protease YdiL (CAAX protease family)